MLHGAGRQDELLMKAYRDEAERRQALFLVPRSLPHDVGPDRAGCAGRQPRERGQRAPSDRPDLDFLEYAYDLIFRRYPIDPGRIGLIGYSDGASYALSVGLSNPQLFRAVMGWAAGFVAIENDAAAPGTPRPAVLLEYGTHDELFPFEQVAVPMRAAARGLRLRRHLPRRRGRTPLAFGRVPARGARLVLLGALAAALVAWTPSAPSRPRFPRGSTRSPGRAGTGAW